ncbi:MAG TPA: LamG-like jellyroll fold domain-containing protein, partial [Gemmatimonadaceae bacterium]
NVTLDATVPVVTLTAPGAGATVSGASVAFAATATDNLTMAGVTLLVDGNAVGTEITGAGPTFNGTWNTTTIANGAHSLSARARDAAGNTAVSPTVSVTVTNATPSNLVAAYSFNEGSGGTTSDISGNNNNGTLGAGVSWTASGKNGNALTFANSFVTVPHAASLNLTAAMTVEAWVYPTANAEWATAVMKEQPGEFVYSLYASGPQRPGAYFNIGTTPSTERSIVSPTQLALNTWTHLAQTFDGATLRLYMNGTQVASQGFTGPIATSTGALRIGGNGVWGEYFSGRIDDVRIYSRALTAAELQTDMITPVGGTPAPDVVAPTVAISAPAAGANVTGIVSLAASASDNVGVAGVQFLVDGSPVGGEVTVAPYSTNWNATNLSGQHTIAAIARDAAGNSTQSASIQVTVIASNPSVVGQWAPPFAWPLVGLHAALLKTGEVLSWEYDGAGGPYLWNPTTGQFTAVPEATNKFCAGQAALPDGRFLIAGGHTGAHVGITNLNIFDPVTRTWTAAPNMQYARWYPTITGLPDGRSLITAGEINCGGCNALIPEIYNSTTNQVSRLNSASADFPYYPHMYVMPDGKVFAAATAEAPIVSKLLNLSNNSWSTVDPVAVDGGSSVMYLPGKIMKSGTSHDPDLPPDPATNKTYTIDMTAASPKWVETAPMAFPRAYHNLTSLPDGNVLVTGGGVTTDAINAGGAVLTAEMWSPTTKTYTTLSSGSVPRLYHSWAMLLPDARVLIGAGGRFNGYPSNDPSDILNAEIYSPAYLFKGTRPTITSAPSTANVNTSITVQTPDAANIASVSLIRLASVTHSFNADGRYLQLSFTAGSGQLSVQMPANANLAPPGHYMLFILDGNGVPSVSKIIRVQ